MNDDRSRLYDDARHSDSNLMRVARERAEVAYCKAKRDGIRDPVVILWLHDDDATSHSPEIARRKEEAALTESLPLSIQAVDRDEVRQGLTTINPALSVRLSTPSPELPFTIVVRTKRGFTAYDTPAPEEG
jgi:hypothetical protein